MEKETAEFIENLSHAATRLGWKEIHTPVDKQSYRAIAEGYEELWGIDPEDGKLKMVPLSILSREPT